jgi:hypothetical protein
LRYLGKALVLRLLGPDILAFACKDAETVGRFDINTIKYNRVYFVGSICGSWSGLMCKWGTETLFRIAFMLLLYKKSMPLNRPLTLSNNSERHNFTLPTYAQAAKKSGVQRTAFTGKQTKAVQPHTLLVENLNKHFTNSKNKDPYGIPKASLGKAYAL